MKNNIKAYEAPEAIVVSLESVDVITTSVSFLDDNVIDDAWVGL